MVCLLQLVRSLRDKYIRLLYARFNRVDHRSLFVDQRAQVCVDRIHVGYVLFQLPDALLLLLQRLQVECLLLRLSLARLLRHLHEVILKGSIVVAVRASRLRSGWSGDRLLRLYLQSCLLQCTLLVLDRLPLDGLECGQRGRVFVYETVALELQMVVFAISQLIDQVLRVVNQLLRIGQNLVTVSRMIISVAPCLMMV